MWARKTPVSIGQQELSPTARERARALATRPSHRPPQKPPPGHQFRMSPGARERLCPSRTKKRRGKLEASGEGKFNSRGSPPPDTWKNDLVHALNLFITRTQDSSLGAVGIEGRKFKLSDVGGTEMDGWGWGDFLASGTNFVPVAAFFLSGGLESFHFPGGAVLLSRADQRRNLPSVPGLQGHTKV